MDLIKDHSSHVEKKAKDTTLRKFDDKRMVELFDRCANAHNTL